MASTLVTAIILLALVAILISLGSAFVFLYRDRSDSRRMARALTVRIVISMVLFLAIVAAMLSGVITPNRPFAG